MPRSGLIRKVDKVGRVAIPSTIRNAFNLREDSMVEFGVAGNVITMQRYSPVCLICGDDKDTSLYRLKSKGGVESEVRLCKSCKNQLNTASPVVSPLDIKEETPWTEN